MLVLVVVKTDAVKVLYKSDSIMLRSLRVHVSRLLRLRYKEASAFGSYYFEAAVSSIMSYYDTIYRT